MMTPPVLALSLLLLGLAAAAVAGVAQSSRPSATKRPLAAPRGPSPRDRETGLKAGNLQQSLKTSTRRRVISNQGGVAWLGPRLGQR